MLAVVCEEVKLFSRNLSVMKQILLYHNKAKQLYSEAQEFYYQDDGHNSSKAGQAPLYFH